MMRWKVSFEFFCNRVSKKALFCLLLSLMAYPSLTEAQMKVFPHLQIFLVPSGTQGGTHFIAFWEEHDRLAAGPFPLRLLELAGLNVLLDLSYSKPNDEQPVSARLKITRPRVSTFGDSDSQVIMDQTADFIAGRGGSKMFPSRPFLVIGHISPSESVLAVGNVLKEIQKRLLACDQQYRQELDVGLNSAKRMSAYEHGIQLIESTFPPCPGRTP